MEKKEEKTFGSWSVKELLALMAIWTVVVLLAMPIFVLGFSQGKDGNMTLWNFIGLVVYPTMLWFGYKAVTHIMEKRMK